MFLTVNVMQHITCYCCSGSGSGWERRRRKEKVVIVARSSMMFWCGILGGTNSNQYTTPSTHHDSPNDFKSQDFNHYPFLTYICINCVIITETAIMFNCYRMTATQLTTFVPLYSCNNNINLKMVAVAAETCWREFSE
jgi:hypothetical protein